MPQIYEKKAVNGRTKILLFLHKVFSENVAK